MLTGGRSTREVEVHPVDWMRTQLETFEQELRDANGMEDWRDAFTRLLSPWEGEQEVGWEDQSEHIKETSCMTEAWRCFSGELEEGVRHLDREEGIEG